MFLFVFSDIKKKKKSLGQQILFETIDFTLYLFRTLVQIRLMAEF